MTNGSFRFEGFSLDEPNRQLLGAEGPVELNGRYFDALALLVSEGGRLIPKTRFMDEVWNGVPVTDEALTQCIKTLRRQLGDDATSPRFIETVPKHGYRFIAPVEWLDGDAGAPASPVVTATQNRRGDFWLTGLSGTSGGAIAGVIGGLSYGFAASPGPGPGPGAISVLLVLLLITTFAATLGAAGVSFGFAAGGLASRNRTLWRIAGAVAGGMIVGAVVKLLGMDAFNLLLGQSPSDMTGGFEGAIIGLAVGVAATLKNPRLRRSAAIATVLGMASALVIWLGSGQMMGSSLNLLSQSFPASRLRLDQIGAVLGETGFGRLSDLVTAALECGLFVGCVVGMMVWIRRNVRDD
jgi:DNA-binding winged helix-turn-helix (wHTH) protein